MAAKTEGMDRWERSPGYVYFIAAGDPPRAVKIGISTQNFMKRRLAGLQGANHEVLRLLAVIPFEGTERPMVDAGRRERQLHIKFAPYQRFKPGTPGGEWFSPAPEILSTAQQGLRPANRQLPDSVAVLRPKTSNVSG